MTHSTSSHAGVNITFQQVQAEQQKDAPQFIQTSYFIMYNADLKLNRNQLPGLNMSFYQVREQPALPTVYNICMYMCTYHICVSYVSRHTSNIIHHTSCIVHHTSYYVIQYRISYIRCHALYIIYHLTHFTNHIAYIVNVAYIIYPI